MILHTSHMDGKDVDGYDYYEWDGGEEWDEDIELLYLEEFH